MKKFDVPLVAEVEVIFRGIEAPSAAEAEQLVSKMWAEGVRPQEEKPNVTALEVGPALELITPKPYRPKIKKQRKQ